SRGGKSPVAQELAESPRLRIASAELLDAGPARSSGAAHIGGPHPPRRQFAQHCGADAAARLLHDHAGCADLPDQLADGVEATAKIAVSAGLHQLLRRVEVDGD